MRTKIEAVLTPIWLLALSILVTIYLAWGFYYFDIDWMHLLNYVILGKTELWHNFNILMQYLTFPWVGHLAMPDFPSSESGLKHFHDVKWLFHLVQGLVILLAYPAVTSLWRNVKKGTFDPIINVLPEEYFLQCFVIFFIIYEGIMVSLTLLARKQLKMYLKNKE